MNKKPKVLAVTGISGSGKTPVCHYLMWELRYPYQPEVAEYLIYQGYICGIKADNILFDYYIKNMELNRDTQLISQLPCWIVETWHIGNLAHMYARESPLFDLYFKEANQSISNVDALCLHIRGSIENSVDRCNRLNILGETKSTYTPEPFLRKVLEGYDYVYNHLGVKVEEIPAERSTLKQLESEALQLAKKFFGELEWNYA